MPLNRSMKRLFHSSLPGQGAIYLNFSVIPWDLNHVVALMP